MCSAVGFPKGCHVVHLVYNPCRSIFCYGRERARRLRNIVGLPFAIFYMYILLVGY